MKYQKLASKRAKESTFDRAKIGAVIVKAGRVLSSSSNKLRYTKKNDRPWPSVHAEEAAILKVLSLQDGLKHLAGATLYVSRVLKDGSTACAKPCKECQQLIDSVGIKKVIYTK